MWVQLLEEEAKILDLGRGITGALVPAAGLEACRCWRTVGLDEYCFSYPEAVRANQAG
jgi:hypothetical protein